jgi:hypothetical protein
MFLILLLLKVYGAFRMYVKVLLMWDSKIQIDGGAKDVVLSSMLEARNLVVLRVSCLKPLSVFFLAAGIHFFLLIAVTAWVSYIIQC